MYFKFDPANNTPVNQRMFIHSLEYALLTDNGLKIDFLTRYKQNAVGDDKDDVGQVEKVAVRFTKNTNYLQVGDNTVRYAELAMPYLALQGLQGRYRIGSVYLDGFTGKRPGNYWGRSIVENYLQDKDRDVDVSGGRLSWYVNNALDVGYTFGGRQAESDNPLGTYSVQSGDLTYRRGAYRFVTEFASSTEKKENASAYRGELNYDAENYGWNIAYRDITPEFRSLADYFNYGGMQGVSLYGRANPLGSLSLSGSYENYLQRFAKDYVTNPEYSVERLRLRLGLNKIIFFRPSLLYHANYRDEYRSTGITAQLYEIEILRRLLWAYTDFSTWRYASPYAEYSVNSSLVGVMYRLGWFTWKTESLNEKSSFVFGGEEHGTSGWNVIANFGEFTLPAQVKMNLSYWYQHRENTLDTVDKNRNSVRLRLGQTIGDLYWYLNGIAARENSLFYEYDGAYARSGYFYHDELVQSEISGGLVYRF
jgi:hypothetical protein